MHNFTVDPVTALVEVTLEGLISIDESRNLCAELRRILGTLGRRPIKILVDASLLQPVPPEVADEFRAVQQFGLSRGVERVAQVVDSSVVLLQRNRIMRESGADPKTRTFRDRDEARGWLLSSPTIVPPR